ncbi:hypothetical protein [Desulforamulus aeronauticus]|nr:hypothetical protein [Desulforamulus aeronauticus]
MEREANQDQSAHSTDPATQGKESIERETEDILAKYFHQKFPATEVIDKCLVDIDNDGLPELLVALNTYSGASKDAEIIKNGLTPLYVAVVFPKGSNPTESLSVIGKTVPEDFSFRGTHLFTVEKEGERVDRVKVKAVNSQGSEHYFTLKVTVEEDGVRSFS